MLSKRRQSTSVQVIALITLLCLVGYFIFPRKPSAATYSDSWYEEDGLVDMTSSQKELAAIAAAAVEAKQAIQEPTRKVMNTNGPGRVKGAFVILARNSDLNGVRHSMRQVEDRFNRNFNYPYVFLNEKDFTDEFKEKTSQLTKAEVMYGKVDESMWGYPDYINQTYARECREDYAQRHIIYGGSEPYRHMCRYVYQRMCA